MLESHDWNQTKELLVVASTSAFRAFFEVHPLNTVRAVGYTWECGQAEAAFYCVAYTQQGLEQGRANCNLYRSSKLSEAEAREEVRWNAGYFPYPAGLNGLKVFKTGEEVLSPQAHLQEPYSTAKLVRMLGRTEAE